MEDLAARADALVLVDGVISVYRQQYTMVVEANPARYDSFSVRLQGDFQLFAMPVVSGFFSLPPSGIVQRDILL